ncbi:MAG TPA: hypothetical protein VMQ60_05180 [Acidobacteriaceae bacterium]|nr:hypothetical protein [Acidobacteriaceae bacterium]
MTFERDAPVRGTQSFVHTLAACWKRPSLTALEVLWRWAFGVPALALIAYEAPGVWCQAQLDTTALRQISLLDPMIAATTLAQTATVLMPPVLRVAEWLVPLLLVVWVIVSSFGRVAVLRYADAQLHARPGTLMLLQTARMTALLGSFVLWFESLHAATEIAVNLPIATQHDPNLVLYCTLVIIATLGMFTLWAVVSWVFSIAPLLAMLGNLGAGASLAAAFRLGKLRSRLVEINLVMGIVKIALIVLAMVFSATPLPFDSVVTAQFMAWWYAGVTVLYLVASDFFHVVRLVAYLKLWKSFNHESLQTHPC